MVGPDRDAPRGVAPHSRTPVKVLICDDHEVLRQGLRTVLRRTPDLVVVAEAADAEQALALAESLHPAVTLVGLGGRGVVVQNLVAALTGMGVRVVLLGETGAGGDPVDALRAGARGYMRTAVSPERLVEGVRSVAQGETVLDADVAGELLQHLDAPRRDAAGAAGRGNPLTGRQEAVSELVAEGLTNAEIADRLQVSRATVKGHITVALRRLGLRDRTQLAIYVHRSHGRNSGREEGPLSG